MDLIFSETANRQQCGSEVMVNDFKVQCAFSTSRVVTIPEGLHYFDGKLDFSRGIPGSILSICRNHESRLKTAFTQLVKQSE